MQKSPADPEGRRGRLAGLRRIKDAGLWLMLST